MNNIEINSSDNNSNYNEDKQSIYIMDLIKDLENLGGEKEKDDFIKNYARLKEQIELTDNILNSKDLKYNDISSLTIPELFNILELNSQYILNPEKLETSKLKYLLEISNFLEEKLNTETMNIIESK